MKPQSSNVLPTVPQPKRPRTSLKLTRFAKNLLAQGIVLKDSAAGTTWEVAQ